MHKLHHLRHLEGVIMNIQHWAAVAADKDFEYALSEIFHYSYTVELDGASAATMAYALMVLAHEVIDYDDPWDKARDFKCELTGSQTNERSRRIAVMQEWLSSFADKRYQLRHNRDDVLSRRMAEYSRIKNTIRMLESVSEASHGEDIDQGEVEDLLHTLKDDLLLTGVPRMTLARAFAEAAFLYAQMAGSGFYSLFCSAEIPALAGQDVIASRTTMPEAVYSRSVH
jgi:hypothetical protein